MSNAWETTSDDVLNVVHKLGKKITGDKTEEIHNNLDMYLIENEALRGDSIEDQTNYAYQEIARQIKEGNLL